MRYFLLVFNLPHLTTSKLQLFRTALAFLFKDIKGRTVLDECEMGFKMIILYQLSTVETQLLDAVVAVAFQIHIRGGEQRNKKYCTSLRKGHLLPHAFTPFS